jgi:hypothetical protein
LRSEHMGSPLDDIRSLWFWPPSSVLRL